MSFFGTLAFCAVLPYLPFPSLTFPLPAVQSPLRLASKPLHSWSRPRLFSFWCILSVATLVSSSCFARCTPSCRSRISALQSSASGSCRRRPGNFSGIYSTRGVLGDCIQVELLVHRNRCDNVLNPDGWVCQTMSLLLNSLLTRQAFILIRSIF